jgi:general stress protein 26
METTNFADIAAEFEARARKHVWCSVATVDRGGRPRSRVLHPVWQRATGWVTTRPDSFKAKHIASNPFLSCGYVDAERPMYVDCLAEWVDNPETKQQAWDFIKSQPEPYGFDPGFIWPGPLHETFGLLMLTPWRIQLTTALAGQAPETTIWRPTLE